MQYNKVSDTQAEIVTTTTSTQLFTLDQLLYDKDSLLRTITNNDTENTERNTHITEQIAVLDNQIQELRDLGIMTQEEFDAQKE